MASGDPFDAIADPHRRTILVLLSAHDRSVSELAAELPISRPAVSRHLRILSEAGLVDGEPRGTRRLYALKAEGVGVVEDYLRSVWGDALHAFKASAEAPETRRRDSAA